ncbi:MAG TPA: cytochrome c3 family protein [Syntrophorhabdaceae bacterium]|nr:cytochrome c3 family protein [Syntrophorhabdaceae bacterium]HQM81548.1 cytochrome c3 family protein [Syntrophorhabdaceae bacterium]
MRAALFAIAPCIGVALFVVTIISVSGAQKQVPEPLSLLLEGAKLPPTPFSHAAHAEKRKIECVICHHKDKDPKEPDKCTTCHLLKEVKDSVPTAKDAFHKNCQTCHKESAAKGVNAPTKCAECHKK